MANIMSMKHIRNKPTRSGFDLSQKINFTAKAGEILPIWWTPLLPFDDARVMVKNFIRTQPLNTAAFARMRGYFDFFFVPYNMLWNKFNTSITQMTSNLLHANGPLLSDNTPLGSQLPYITAQQISGYVGNLSDKKNEFGYYRAHLTCKLLEYLGYGLFYDYISTKAGGLGYTWLTNPMSVNLKFSPFPLLAYHKIYSDYYRYSQWERTNPSSFNIDYITGKSDLNLSLLDSDFINDVNFFDLQYCNFARDLLHGTIPEAQYGTASVVPIDAAKSDLVGSMLTNLPFSYTGDNGRVIAVDDSLTYTPDDRYRPYRIGVVDSSTGKVNSGSGSNSLAGLRFKVDEGLLNSTLSVLALRRAEAAQKWREISMANESDYNSQIQAHWGQSVSPLMSEMCQRLDSVVVDLSINEVVNQNITGDNAADIAGKGSMSGSGNVNFNSGGRYGIIMCVFHVLPQLDYTTSAPHFGTTLTDVTQYPIPEFDKIGMELVPSIRGFNPVYNRKDYPSGYPLRDLFFGYAPQYYDWKTSLDKSMGEFRNSLQSWIIGFDDISLLGGNAVYIPQTPNVQINSVKPGFFKCDPAILNNLFAVNANSQLNTDQFLSSTFFDVKVVRSLDVDGLPY